MPSMLHLLPSPDAASCLAPSPPPAVLLRCSVDQFLRVMVMVSAGGGHGDEEGGAAQLLTFTVAPRPRPPMDSRSTDHDHKDCFFVHGREYVPLVCCLFLFPLVSKVAGVLLYFWLPSLMILRHGFSGIILFVYLSVSTPICLSVSMSVCPALCLSGCLFQYLSVCIHVCLSMFVPVCLYAVCLSAS